MLDRKKVESLCEAGQLSAHDLDEQNTDRCSKPAKLTPVSSQAVVQREFFGQLRREAEAALVAVREEYLVALRLPEATLRDAIRKSVLLRRLLSRVNEIERAKLRLT
jgi:hypothetical protein